MATVMSIFIPVNYPPALLFSMNAPLFLMASFESHEIIAKRKEAGTFYRCYW
ncbi:hypothetical protein AAAC51_08315 [Priestia megaterium]